MFRKVLIANRGEIAVRVIQACAEIGIATVAVYSEADAGALHVRRAGEAVCIGPPPATQSYLNIPALIAAALQTRADAVHPGYGFLSENADFAQACADAGLRFIGPSPAAIRAMGSKIAAKQLAATLGIPLLPGYDGADQRDTTLAIEAERAGYPLLIKASAGGGGRGMRGVRTTEEFAEALAGARREAASAFGDDAVLLERYLERPRHVEIQVFGDTHGNLVHLGERECSIQRRHQKVIEEAPSPAVSPALRAEMGESALRLARAIGYTGAGTVEFLLDEQGRYAFLEMNTRIQVEHGVTELVTGLDLVRLQLLVAAGERLPFTQEDVTLRGHAIECRIYAEDAARGFAPSTGRITTFAPPQGAGIRNDVGVESGDVVSPYYDPMLAKLLVVGPSRQDAIDRATAALRRYHVDGVTTNIGLLVITLEHPDFRIGDTSTSFFDDHLLHPSSFEPAIHTDALIAAAIEVAYDAHAHNPWSQGWRPAGAEQTVVLEPDGMSPFRVTLRRDGPASWLATPPKWDPMPATRTGDRVTVTHGDDQHTVRVVRRGDQIEVHDGPSEYLLRPGGPPDVGAAALGARPKAGGRTIIAPLTGVVVKVMATEGDAVAAGQPLLLLEAMKMEHVISSPLDATVSRILAAPGDLVQAGALLVQLGDPPGN